MTPPDHSAGSPDGGGDPFERPRPDGRRALLVGLSLSAVVHLVVILLYPSLSEPDGGSTVLPSFEQPSRLQGTELIRIVELPPEAEEEPEVEPPVEPDEDEPPPAAPAGPPADARTEAEPGEEEERPTAAERLRPRAGDLRLWAPLPDEATALSDQQRMELELILRLRDVADSAEAVAEAYRRARDWTYTDAEGRKWGVSPGKIHLGDLTLPLPFGFGSPYGSGDRERAWEWEELERGADAAAQRETVKDRARAIRERRDREREEAREGAPPSRPDTSGVRRRR